MLIKIITIIIYRIIELLLATCSEKWGRISCGTRHTSLRVAERCC